MEEKKNERPGMGQERRMEPEAGWWKRIAELRERDLSAANAECFELHQKLDSQIEWTSRLVGDCDAWRVKYRALLKEAEGLRTRNASISDRIATLEKSNNLLEEELARVRNANVAVGKQCAALIQESQTLKSRGFWARVFNR